MLFFLIKQWQIYMYRKIINVMDTIISIQDET